jgi:hypothetical protein
MKCNLTRFTESTTLFTLLTVEYYDAVLPTEKRENVQHRDYIYSYTPVIVQKGKVVLVLN